MTLIAFGSSHHPAAKSGMHTGLATVATASEQVVRALRTLPKLTVEQHDELAGDKTLRDAFIAQVYQELQRAGTTRHGLSTELPDIHPQSDVLAAMNFSVDPCDNFYEFVCGRWIQDTPIPPDKAVLQKSYSEAQDLVRKQMADMLEDTETPQETPARQRLADYYAACMDVNYVDSLNAAPIMKLLDKIDAIVTHDDLADMIAELASRAMPSLMAMKVSVDADRTRHIIKVTGRNMGMSLPDPSYYAPGVNNASKENSSTPEMEEALAWRRLNFMTLFKEFEALHQLTGLSQEQARKMTTMTMNAEIRLASFFSREPIKEYLVKHPGGLQDTSLEELEQRMPNLPWRRTLEKLAAACGSYNTSCTGLHTVLDNPRMPVVNMDMPVYYASISEALGEYDPASWAPLLRSHVVKQWAPLLGTHFEKVILEAMTALNGVQERPARWHKCSSAAMAALPHEADEVYRELFFPPAAQASGERLLTAIRDAFVHNLETVDWLGRGNDTATRAMALRKAKALTMSLGGTNEPYYTTFAVSRRQYFDNALRAMQAKMIADFSQLGQPVKRNHWNMAAFSVNAYYDRSLNALFIPAGIMQPPFFSPSFTGPADGRLARDFGGIGTVIGHEFSHGFDNNGAKYDDHSLLANWWSPEVCQFSHFCFPASLPQKARNEKGGTAKCNTCNTWAGGEGVRPQDLVHSRPVRGLQVSGHHGGRQADRA